MNKLFKNITFVATALVLLSCSNEILGDVDDIQNETTTFTARQESLTDDGELFGASVTTRTSLANDKSIAWNKDDAVNVYDGISISKFVVTSDNNTSTCTFAAQGSAGVKKSNTYLALYPYSLSATFGSNKISNLSLPANQEATAGGFAPSCNLMVANYDATSSTLNFRNVCSYIKLSTTFDCSRIVITFNDAVAKPTGTFDVTLSDDGVPVIGNVTNDAEDKNVVRLLGDIKAGVDYYIAVLPGTYEGGLKVTLEPKNAADMIDWTNKNINISPYYRSTSVNVVMNRSKNKSFGTFDTSLSQESEMTTDFEDLLGYGEKYNNGTSLPEHGKIVLWAKKNIGASEETAAGSYFAWGEVKTKNNADYTYAKYLCQDYYPSLLDKSHDAAAVNYGEGWKIPTDEEFSDLKTECIFVYDDESNGYYVYPGKGNIKDLQYVCDSNQGWGVYRVPTGMSGNAVKFNDTTEEYQYVMNLKTNGPSSTTISHIFLPLGGYKDGGSDTKNFANQGFYWTNGHGDKTLLSGSGENAAYYLGIGSGQGDRFNMKSYAKPVYYGFNVRPVFVYEW